MGDDIDALLGLPVPGPALIGFRAKTVSFHRSRLSTPANTRWQTGDDWWLVCERGDSDGSCVRLTARGICVTTVSLWCKGKMPCCGEAADCRSHKA